jgi:hypothetical protein
MSTDPPIPREVFGTATEIGTALLVARHEGDKVSSPAAGSVHVFVCVPRQELDIGIRDPTPQRVIVTHWGTVRECGALETADP